jgi:hypothetical protein
MVDVTLVTGAVATMGIPEGSGQPHRRTIDNPEKIKEKNMEYFFIVLTDKGNGDKNAWFINLMNVATKLDSISHLTK